MATLPGFDAAIGQSNLQRLSIITPAADPLAIVSENTPPAVIFHGTFDTTITIDKVYAYQAALFERGNDCQVQAYESQPHAFFNYRAGKNPYSNETVGDMLLYLEEQGYLND